jgi:hypothetical protein
MKRMSYYKPTDNITQDGIIVIPIYQQKDKKYFSFIYKDKYSNLIVLDNFIEIEKNYLINLKRPAEILNITNCKKMNKDELVESLQNKIIFMN